MIFLRSSTLRAVAAVASAFAIVACGSAKTRTGILTGAIYLSGGPAAPYGGSVCHGDRCSGAGTITVRDSANRVVAHTNVRSQQHFRFALSSGTYVISGGLGCVAEKSTVHVGRTSIANLVCNIK